MLEALTLPVMIVLGLAIGIFLMAAIFTLAKWGC